MSCTCDMNGQGARCHCRRCCLTFTGISAFDQHQVSGACREPAGRGLVLTRPGVWGWPGPGPRFAFPGREEASQPVPS